MNDIESPSSRLGKIARLPATLRRTLNQRLEDNEPGPRLVAWLNALPEVQQVLADLFEGRPISEQNLSAWKQGGFRDWQRHQQNRARARDFLEEARELAEEVSTSEEGGSLLDRVGDHMALALLQLFREAEDAEPGPTRTRTMLEIVEKLGRLRKGDHQRKQAAVLQQRWQHERDLTLREVHEHEEKHERKKIARLTAEARAYRREYIRGLAGNIHFTLERQQWIRDFFARHLRTLRAHGLPSLPKGRELDNEIRWEKVRPVGTQGGLNEAAFYGRHFASGEAKAKPRQGKSSRVKAPQAKPSPKNSPAEGDDAQPE